MLAAAVALMMQAVTAAERPYAFRARLETVHHADRRDSAAQAKAEEFAFADGAVIAVPSDASDFVVRVARDFEDYLLVSMRVSARVARGGAGAVVATVDPSLPARQYRVDVGASGVRLAGADERALAQAFYHLEDRMNLRRGPFLAYGRTVRTPRFATRLTQPGYGYSMFTDEHLNTMAHAGLTAIVVYYYGENRLGENTRADHAAIIRRAKKYGLDTYLYSEVHAFHHPDEGDAPFEKAYGPMAEALSEAKGLIIVGESCQFPSKDPRVQPRTWAQKGLPGDARPLAGWFPCKDYPDWIRAVQRVVAKHAPEMKIVFWTYNWGWAPAKDRLALVDALPPDTILQATFEMFERQRKRNGLDAPTADYSLSFVGPGSYFRTEAEAAHRRGLTLFAQANAGGRTWDFGTAPYEPFPMQWRRRWEALVKAHDAWGLSGIMENHHYGWSPTFIAELEKEAYTEGGLPFDAHLRAIAARDFGAENAEKAVAAWAKWSEAITDYVATDLNQYGPFRCGPAYPFTFGRPPATQEEFPVEALSEVGSGFIRMEYLKKGFIPELVKEDSSVPYMQKEIELLDGMVASLSEGADAFAAMPGEEARRMAGLGRYLAACCRTAANVKRGAIAEAAGDEAGILAAAKDEYANAKAALELVEADSHLGWEPMMDYVGGPRQIRWKLQKMESLYPLR